MKAMTIESAQIVSDGFLSISIKDAAVKVDQGKLSAIEVKLVGPHYAHAVSGGPYKAVDLDGDGLAVVNVDGGESHTHMAGKMINQWHWKKGAIQLATGKTAELTLAVGEHTVAMTAIDSAMNESTESFTVTVLPFGYPAVTTVTPSSGSIVGGEQVTIRGSGFTYSAAQTIVHFGLIELTGNDIQIIDKFTITLFTPVTLVGAPVRVTVETPLAETNHAI